MLLQLILIFFFIALIYSSIGFGGGSSYLAILSLFAIDYEMLRIIALACNLTVVGGAFYWYYKHKLYNFKKIIPIVLFSIPLAYLGGKMRLTEEKFFILLGCVLLVSGIIMMVQTFVKISDEELGNKPSNYALNGFIGASVGFLSGLVGIGGGIFLSPILHFQKWDKSLIIAATSSFFILVNSIAGLAGSLSQQNTALNWNLLLALIIAVFIGGQLGTRVSIKYLNELIIKRMTAVLIICIGIRILIKY